jgi:hypothetical protein
VQIQQRVHLDGGLVLAKSSPRKQRQTEIDSGGIQGIQALIQIHTDRIVRIQRTGDTDEHLCEVGENAPVVRLVRVGQIRARHASTKSHVIQLAADGAQASFDITQAFAVSELSESHRQILVPAREASKVSVASIARHTLLKLVERQVIHELREDGPAEVHSTFSAKTSMAGDRGFAPGSALKISNRKI